MQLQMEVIKRKKGNIEKKNTQIRKKEFKKISVIKIQSVCFSIRGWVSGLITQVRSCK